MSSTRSKNKNAPKHQCQVTQVTRSSKRKSVSASCIVCPACTLSLRGNDAFKSHYKEELEKMNNPFENLSAKKKQFKMRLRSSPLDETDDVTKKDNVQEVVELPFEERECSLRDIKKRKYSRYADMFLVSINKKQTDSNSITAGYDIFSCIVCNDFLDSSEELATKHLAKCLAKRELEYDLYSSDDDSEEETVEEFSWAGQTWIRTSSLLDTDIRGEGKLTRLEMEDGDEELDVDGDHNCEFGHEQYCEADVIPCLSEEGSKKSQQALRQAVANDLSKNKQQKDNSSSSSSRTIWKEDDVVPLEEDTSVKTLEKQADGDQEKFISLLKDKVCCMEKKEERSSKCPICMGAYTNPVVSTSCWHVCCSECWLRALGAKKLCPKCNSIVSPSQLRKIFL